jgi:uncharacterized protein YjdB
MTIRWSVAFVLGFALACAQYGCKRHSEEPAAEAARPTPVPRTLELSRTSVTLFTAGAQVPIHATVKDAQGLPILDAQVAWTSSDPAVAEVADGMVKAKKSGKTVVTAAIGALQASAEVNIPEAMKVEIEPKLWEAHVGEGRNFIAHVRDERGFDLPGKNAQWRVSNPTVVEFEGGTAVAISAGDAEVVATYGELSDHATIHVAAAPAKR